MQFATPAVAKRLVLIFILSFLLNFVWEHAHAPLYAAYEGGPITNWILLKAILGDALFITALSIFFFRSSRLRHRLWLAIPVGVVFAALLELFATSIGHWEYNSLMPIVPLIHTGLTPTIQLGLLGYITFVIAGYFEKK